MQLRLEPALLKPVHPRQCLIEQLQCLAGFLDCDVELRQQAEKAGCDCWTPHSLLPPTSAQLGDACRSRRRRPRPAVKDRRHCADQPKPCSVANVISALPARSTDSRSPTYLMEPAGQVQGLARGKGMAQLVRSGERLSAARQGRSRIALQQQNQSREKEASPRGCQAPTRYTGRRDRPDRRGRAPARVRHRAAQLPVEQQAGAQAAVAYGLRGASCRCSAKRSSSPAIWRATSLLDAMQVMREQPRQGGQELRDLAPLVA